MSVPAPLPRPAVPRIAIVTDARGWHENRLGKALLRRGTPPVFLSLQDCRFHSDAPYGLDLPGFPDTPPAGVLVRNVPGGSFEQVTFRLEILHALQALGTSVYNQARVIEKTVDKAMTSFLLARAGVATAPAWTLESERQARQIVRRETAAGCKLVLKPLFGNRGQGLVLLEDAADLPDSPDCNGVFYLQHFVGAETTAGRDWRVMVVGGRAIGAMERRALGWITNRARGGECRPAMLGKDLATLAEQAATALGAGYAGVDIAHHPEHGYLVLEVNGIPAWRGLQTVCTADIAGALADDFLARIHHRQTEAVG